MSLEIERKFIVNGNEWRKHTTASHSYEQAYLSTDPDATVRLRMIDREKAFITIKSRNRGAVRHEWEYAVPADEAEEMFSTLPLLAHISKTRHIAGRWEIDEFHGCLEGLVVAEIEMNAPDEAVTLPPFIGREVTDDPRYFNSALGAAVAPPAQEEAQDATQEA